MTTQTETNLYTLMAGLLEYPREDIKDRAKAFADALAGCTKYPPEVAEEYGKFMKDLDIMALDDLQGIYSYTFELTSDYSLDMGSHIFDGFRRSNKLSTIKSMYRDNGFPYEQLAKGELPDHLPILLHFLGFVKDEELMKDFRQGFVILALEKLHKNFEKNLRNIYRHLMSAVYRIIETDVKEVK
ncbi:MAG: hypothetical protein HZB85_05595 [Deltaproteobacteria bacterium]|nr:hypothetical protein [Deltaproteobacteria bacterium]